MMSAPNTPYPMSSTGGRTSLPSTGDIGGTAWDVRRKEGPWRLAALAMVLVCACGLTACDKSPTTSGKKAPDTGIHKTFERGPVAVTLDVDHKEISIADRVNLKITVTADEAYQVELPAFGEKLEQFGIVDYHTSPPILKGKQKREESRSYVLEPFLSGEYKIPPMTVRFWKKGEEDKPHEVETEALTVTVTSLLPEKVAELKIHEIADPVRMPHRAGPWGWIVGALLVVVSGTVGGIVFWRRRRARAAAPEHRIPAHVLAFKALEQLIADNLTANGEFKAFYQRLSDILRRYIENRFGLHAPERTTEEFLEDLRSNEKLNNEYRSLLRAFLGHCDLVKFAEHRPETSEIQKAFDSCKGFIVGTREAPDAL